MLRHNSAALALENLIQTGLKERHFVGVGVVLIQDGQISHAAGYGTTNLIDGGCSVNPDTLFAIGSVSKLICATMIMRLVEQEVLDLDRPVVEYLPEFKFSNMEYGRQITLRHLLSHTSGLPSGGRDYGPRDRDALRRVVWEEIPHYRFIGAPGRYHQYSNTAFCLAGHVAEAVTGHDYDHLVTEQVFKPLGMNHSTFDPTVAMTYPLALPHLKKEGEELSVRRRMTRNQAGHPSSFGYSSTADLARLGMMIINHGTLDGESFLAPATVQEMQTPACDLHVRSAAHPFWQIYTGYGLGMQTGRYAGTLIARHGGVNPGFQTFFDLFTLQRAGVIMQFTYLETTPMLDTVMKGWHTVLNLLKRDPFYASAPAAIRKTAPREAKNYVGTFLNLDRGEIARLEMIGRQILLEYQGRQRPLVQVGPTEFYGEISHGVRIPVWMIVDEEDGSCKDILIWGYPFHRIELLEDVEVKAEELDRYCGTYVDRYNRNPQEEIVIQRKDGRLQLHEGETVMIYRPLVGNQFIGDMGIVEFFADEADQVTHFQLGQATCFFKKANS
ncbi:MAG: serine hydrolase domain-containing protein [Ardenticatenaceae bacterium]|nr:serine hydrolase domain-containing protein [Ardenticatenaceae bacterium]